MERLLEFRWEASLGGSLLVGMVALFMSPFPRENWLLLLILSNKPLVFYALAACYHVLLFSTSFFFCSGALFASLYLSAES